MEEENPDPTGFLSDLKTPGALGKEGSVLAGGRALLSSTAVLELKGASHAWGRPPPRSPIESPVPVRAAAGIGIGAIHPREQQRDGMEAQPWREAGHPRRRLGADHRPFPAQRFGLCFPRGEELRVKWRNVWGGGGGDLSPLYVLNGIG